MPRVTSSMALTGERLLFPHGQYIFGRAQGCHILFPMSSAVSRQHCLLSVTEQGAVVRDLGSRNSTVVNSERVPGERPLGHGDRLYLAGFEFLVEMYEDEVADIKAPGTVRGQALGETIGFPEGRTRVESK